MAFKGFPPVSIWPLAMVLPIALIYLFDDAWHNILRFDHAAIAQGEIWRLLTCHFTHLNLNHALLNGGGFLLVAWMQPRGHWLSWWLFYCVGGVVISLLLFWQDQVMWYVGASGLLHGLILLGAWFSHWLEDWRRYVMAVLVTGKLLWEQTPFYNDADVYELIGGHVIVDAHFLGGVLAWLVIAIYIFKPYFQRKITS